MISANIRNMKGTNSETEEFEQDGYRRMSCRMDPAAGFAKSRVLLVGCRMYQVIAFTDGEVFTDADIDRVIKSFAFEVPKDGAGRPGFVSS